MADGEILYEVRASLDKLREDMLSAQDEAKKGGNKLADIAKAGGKAIAGGFAVVGGAAIAAGGYGVNLANDMDVALNSIAAKTGATDAEMQGFRDTLESIYQNNYGDSLQDVADVMSVVNQQFGDISQTDMSTLTEAAFAFQDLSGYSPEESLRAANTLMNQFGLTAEEAYNLMVQGMQNGLDFSGEFLDSINEYSVQFKKNGYDAEGMFNVLKAGAESGAWNLDKIGDAVKENAIRVIDLSDSTTAAFEALGLDADETAAKFGAGGESANKALQEVLLMLSAIEDPLERNQIGTALWGTMWEDLGGDVIMSTGDISDSFDKTYDSMKEIQDIQYDDLGSMLEGLKRSVEMLALPLGEALIPVLTELIEEVLPVIQEVLPDVIEAFETFLEPVLQLASEALPGIIDGFSQLMSDDLMPLMTEEILPALKEAFESLQPVFDLFKDEILPLVVDLFKELMPPIMELINNLIPPLVDVFNALAVPIIDFISSLLPSLKSLFEGVADVVDMLSPVIAYLADMFQDRLQTALNIVKPIVEHVITVFKNIIDFIKNVFTGDWSAAWDNIVNIFKSCFNLIPTIAENVINGAIGVINSLINGVNKITDKIPGDPIGQIPTIGEVSLPRFHTGGIIDFKGKYESPIMAMDGEMVLTAAQQKRLFDIANGAYSPESVTNSSNVNNHTDVKIEHKNYFTVRSDIDIIRISEELSRQDKKDIMSIGGD